MLMQCTDMGNDRIMTLILHYKQCMLLFINQLVVLRSVMTVFTVFLMDEQNMVHNDVCPLLFLSAYTHLIVMYGYSLKVAL